MTDSLTQFWIIKGARYYFREAIGIRYEEIFLLIRRLRLSVCRLFLARGRTLR
jgi:hypothetical protein